jgi:hypothetical protein
MTSNLQFQTMARVVAVSAEEIRLLVPGGWQEVRVSLSAAPEWLGSAMVGQYVICTAQPHEDELELGDWRHVLPIGLDPHPFHTHEYLALPESKLEMISGVLYIDPAARNAMLAALVSNAGLVEVARLAPPGLWDEALSRAYGRRADDIDAAF